MNQKTTQKYIDALQKWFDQLPALPTNARDVIVKITPILALIFGILGILGILSVFSAITAFAPVMMMGRLNGVGYWGYNYLSLVLWLFADIVMLTAYSGVRQRKIIGWNRLFWSQIIYFVGSILSYEIISGLIGIAIALYLLFQIKSYYK